MSRYQYADSASSQTGTMICTACGKPITEGLYRYRDAGDRYVNQHKACSQTDPKWAAMELNALDHEEKRKELSDTCAAFRERWGVSELDEYILTTTPESN